MQENEQVKTVLKDAPYNPETNKKLREHELIDVNFGALIDDFERVYAEVLKQELPLPAEHAGKIKSDLFAAFCRGAVVATDTTSAFRKNFNLPNSVIEAMNKPDIILPDNEIKKPTGKIIV